MEFQRGRADQAHKRRRDPESHHDLVFRPAAKLEMMVQGGAEKEPPPPPLVVGHLQDDAAGLGHEHPAHHHQQQFLPGDHGQQSQQAAQGQRAGIAHEDLGRDGN